MKILLSSAALLITLGTVYLLVSYQKEAQFKRELQLRQSGWEAERAELEAALRAAKQRPAVTARATPAEPAQGGTSAHEILDRLKKTKVQTGDNRNQSVRHIVHLLESLVDLGPEALPAIREFLAKFEDLDYAGELRGEDGESEAKDRPPMPSAGLPGRNVPRLDSILPPSLRLGLVDVLKDIDGEQAEQVLAEMLSTSGRGVEIAYVARALQEMEPNKYRDVAIAAAKDLLANPPPIDRPNRLDENAKNYLYGVLGMYNDQTFASTAQSLLVTQDGRVDRTALTYLTGTLKEEAVPALYQAFKDNRITNMWEKASLATQILSYAGPNEQANEILRELVGNETLPAWLRATAIQTVGGGRGTFFGGSTPTDPAQVKSRIELLNSLPDSGDERLARARLEAIQKLSDQLAMQPDDSAAGRSFRTRLDGGQGAVELPPPLPVAR